MAKRSKRFRQAAEVLKDNGEYPLDSAVETLKNLNPANFDETVEISFRLGVDPRQSDQMVRGVVALPHGSGKKVRVLVFTEDPQKALDAGADYAGLADLVAKIKEGWLDFDVAIATTAAMKEVRAIARVLGPKGLMPNPRSGTVTDDIEEGIKAVKAGRVEYKMDKTANMGVVVGKRSFEPSALVENIQTVIENVGKAKPASLKGRFILNISLSSTMSPGVKLDPTLYSSF